MDAISARQGDVGSDVPEHFSRGLICPHCGSLHCVKNGSVRGTKRFVCRDCGRSFGPNHRSVLMFSKLKPRVWRAYIKCMVEGRTLEASAEIVGVCLKTSFYMRHKILDALASIERDTVDGLVEMDETFVAESFKGNHMKSGFKLSRNPRKRGHEVSMRGLSREQVCIGTALDRKNGLIMAMAGHGRVSYDQLERIYDGYVGMGSTIWTDGVSSYKKRSKKLGKWHQGTIPEAHVTVADAVIDVKVSVLDSSRHGDHVPHVEQSDLLQILRFRVEIGEEKLARDASDIGHFHTRRSDFGDGAENEQCLVFVHLVRSGSILLVGAQNLINHGGRGLSGASAGGKGGQGEQQEQRE